MRIARAEVRVEGAGAVLELADDQGRRGLGEATPLEGRSHETLEASIEALRRVAAALPVVDDAAPAAIGVSAALAPFDDVLAGVPSARFALETALLDALGHRRGASVAELLGGARGHHAVALNALVRLGRGTGGDELARAGERLVAEGFRALKLKLPREQDDATFAGAVAALDVLRSHLPEVELRVDVNGAWTPDVALPRLEALAPLGLRYVEQPVAPEHVDVLEGSPVPWAADESLEPIGAGERLVAEARPAVVVLKPTLLGGLIRARALAEQATTRGLGVVVTHAFDGPIALAAACELALSLSRPPLACGLAPHEGLARHPRRTVRQVASPGFARAVAAPGLGLGDGP